MEDVQLVLIRYGEKKRAFKFNSFAAGDHFRPLLMTFANSLKPDQAQQNVGPDLDPNCLTH